MIKAETITHEATPAPNWLEHCRNVISTGRILALMVVVAAAALIGIARSSQPDTIGNLPATSTSKQASSAILQPLSVQPATTLSPNTAAGTSSIQSANGSAQSVSTASNSSAANSLGAQSTPSLNTSESAASAKQTPVAEPQSQLNGKTITNTVQSLLPDLTQVQNALPKL